MRTCLFLLSVCLVSALGASGQQDSIVHLYFPSGSFVSGSPGLLACRLLLRSGFRVTMIEGNADTVGSDQSNIILAGERLHWVKDFLQRQGAAFDNRPAEKNYGERRAVPTAKNAENRRVDIHFIHPDPVARPPADAGRKPASTWIPAGDASGQIFVSPTGDTFYFARRVDLPNLYFIPDRPIIESYSIGSLKPVADMLRRLDDNVFLITGHVNMPEYGNHANSGYRQTMQKLSDDRAAAVRDALADYGVPPEKMVCEGLSNTKMVYPDPQSESQARKNMRVEILVLTRSRATPAN